MNLSGPLLSSLETQVSVRLVAPATIHRDCLSRMLNAHGAQTVDCESLRECEHEEIILLDLTRGYVQANNLLADLEHVLSPVVVIADDWVTYHAVRGHKAIVGCITSSLTVRGILSAVCFALEGGSFAPPYFTDVSRDLRSKSDNGSLNSEASFWTPREVEILSLLRAGMQNKAIAYELSISISTVKVHIHNIMMKSHSRNRTEVVARKCGLNSG
jgi:DNA-binding NarL/FixJ family response regulator